MNHLVLLPEEQASNNEYLVVGDRAKYLNEFHRFEIQKEYSALVFNEGYGRIKCTSKSNAEYKFSFSALDTQNNIHKQRDITILCAMARPITIKKVLQYSSMFRVKQIIFSESDFAEKSYSQSNIFNPDSIRYEIIKGLEQIGFPYAPKVNLTKNLKDCSSYFKEVIKDEIRILADPSAPNLIKKAIKAAPPPRSALAIGPERGWTAKEIDYLKSINFQHLSLNEDHYRVEVALATIMAYLI